MAPIKFEEHIREQLEKREINPSEDSWEKLNARLENSSPKKDTSWWIGVAAAVVVCLVVSLFFINQQKQNVSPIVENPVEEKPVQKSEEFEEPAALASEENESEVIKENAKPEKVAEKVKATEKNENNQQPAIASAKAENPEKEGRQKTSPAVAQISPADEIPPILTHEKKPEIEKNLLNTKIDELVAKVYSQEKAGETVSDEEVNALLAEAAKEISRERIFYSKGSVDAGELLAEVESEIDQSFRQEVFQLLKEGFIKAKTAIASRNY